MRSVSDVRVSFCGWFYIDYTPFFRGKLCPIIRGRFSVLSARFIFIILISLMLVNFVVIFEFRSRGM